MILRPWTIQLLMVAAILFAVPAFAYQTFPGDTRAILWVQTLHNSELTSVMEFISFFGRTWVVWTIGLSVSLMLIFLGRQQQCYCLFWVLAITVLNPLMKFIVDRDRPTPDLVNLSEPFQGNSFPSGHTFGALVLYGLIIFLVPAFIHRKWLRRLIQIPLIGLVAGMGLSRVYLGAHWPSDVIGAYLIGALFLLLVIWRYRFGTFGQAEPSRIWIFATRNFRTSAA